MKHVTGDTLEHYEFIQENTLPFTVKITNKLASSYNLTNYNIGIRHTLHGNTLDDSDSLRSQKTSAAMTSSSRKPSYARNSGDGLALAYDKTSGRQCLRMKRKTQ